MYAAPVPGINNSVLLGFYRGLLMRAGLLRQSITIQKPTFPRTGVAGSGTTWTDVATIYAKVAPTSGREFWSAQAEKAETTHNITIRYRGDVQSNWRIQFGNRIFDIKGIVNTMERNFQLVLLATETE